MSFLKLLNDIVLTVFQELTSLLFSYRLIYFLRQVHYLFSFSFPLFLKLLKGKSPPFVGQASVFRLKNKHWLHTSKGIPIIMRQDNPLLTIIGLDRINLGNPSIINYTQQTYLFLLSSSTTDTFLLVAFFILRVTRFNNIINILSSPSKTLFLSGYKDSPTPYSLFDTLSH